jgi:Raf kinase inhibitor-like YbhB/YbcL family protein
VLLAPLLLAAACSSDGRSLREPGTGGATPRPVPETTTTIDVFAGVKPGDFVLRSPAARDGDLLPVRHARGGSNIAPEVRWQGVPAEAVELALVMVDINANNFVHWVVTGIDPATPGLFEALVPPGAVQALNDFGELGWGGPAPPIGEDAHSYVFKLFALGEPSGMQSGELGSAAIPMLEAKAIGVTELITFYGQTAALDP